MTQAFLFFHFNLLCQRLEYSCFANTTAVFLPFLYCFLPFAFFPLLLGHFALCPLKFCPLFSYSRLFHSLSFGAVYAFSQYLFVSTAVFLPFLYCFLPFAPLPFAVCYLGILLFALWKFTRLLILCCIIRCLFGAVLALLQCLFVSTAIFLPFLYCFLPLCPFPLLLGHFARCHLKFCP